MSHRFVRCPYCSVPHAADARTCEATGLPLPRGTKLEAPKSRMSEVPPPERRPNPLAFDASRHRVDEPAKRPSSGTTKRPVAHDDLDIIGTVIGGRYQVRGILGEGGMGTVYEAAHLGLDRPVAVKVLHPAQAKKQVAVKRFQQEARTAGAIGHPNICEIYDMGTLDDGRPYLVMEKLSGKTLADAITEQRRLAFAELATVMTQVLSGLVAAHGKGVLHRDIKPENIFLAERAGARPVAKILDFGVSKMMVNVTKSEDFDLTKTGMVMGTPYYMSPEQARGKRDLDGRVDVYACGVMMYEAICGVRPFRAPNYNALLLAIVTADPTPIRELRPETPDALVAIVKRAMTRARAERYGAATDMLRDVHALFERSPRTHAAASGTKTIDREPRRTPSDRPRVWPYDEPPSERPTNVAIKWSAPAEAMHDGARRDDGAGEPVVPRHLDFLDETRTKVWAGKNRSVEPIASEPAPRGRQANEGSQHQYGEGFDDTFATLPLPRDRAAREAKVEASAKAFTPAETLEIEELEEVEVEVELDLERDTDRPLDQTDARTIPRRRL